MRGLILVLAIGVMAQQRALAGEITIATDPANPPYSEADASGEVRGFERELGDALCRRLQLECEWVTDARGTLVPGLLAGEYDTVLAALAVDGDYGTDVSTHAGLSVPEYLRDRRLGKDRT